MSGKDMSGIENGSNLSDPDQNMNSSRANTLSNVLDDIVPPTQSPTSKTAVDSSTSPQSSNMYPNTDRSDATHISYTPGDKTKLHDSSDLNDTDVVTDNVFTTNGNFDGRSSVRARSNTNSSAPILFRQSSTRPLIAQPEFNHSGGHDDEDGEYIDENTLLQRKNINYADTEDIYPDELHADDITKAELQGPPSSLYPFTLRFKNKHLEAMFWGYNLPNYRRYAKYSFIGCFLLFLIMLIQDVLFYSFTWKDAQICEDLFSPACRSLGFRIIVSVFFVPAYALMLYLVVRYAEALYDVNYKSVCMIKSVPFDLSLSALFATCIIIVSRTINTSDAIMPVDYAAVCIFLFCLHLTAAFLNQSFGSSIISFIGYFIYMGTTIGFAFSKDGEFMYSHDYASGAKISTWSNNPVYDMKERAYEIIWALLWPLCINILSIIGARAIEMSRRKSFALIRAYMLISQENDNLERQRNAIWNELCTITDNRSNMIDNGDPYDKKQDNEIDFTSPAELAMKLLQDIQQDSSVSNEVLLKARQVAEIMMKPGDLYTPAIVVPTIDNNPALGVDIDNVGGDTKDEQQEMQRWVASLVNGDKNSVPTLPEKDGIIVDPTSGETTVVNPNTGNKVVVMDDEKQIVLPCLQPILGALSTVDVVNYASSLDDWDTDIEEVTRIVGAENVLVYVTMTIMRKYNLFNKFEIDTVKMTNFIKSVAGYYHDNTNAFHNSIHAADVVKNVNCLLYHSGLYTVLSDVYLLSIILAALVIDVGHPGIDSNFHIETSHELALVYNDRGVLENYHAAVLARCLMQHKVLDNVTLERRKQIRSNSIELLLATDLNVHFDVLGQHKTILAGAMAMNLSLADQSPDGGIDNLTNANMQDELQVYRTPTSTEVMLHKLKLSLLKLTLKCADMGYCAKPLHIHNRWSAYLFDEQFKQGDEEAKLGFVVSPFMSREKTNVPLAQIGFIDYIAKPMFDLLCDALEIDNTTVKCQEYILANRQHWVTIQNKQA